MKKHRLTPHEETVIVQACRRLDPGCAVYLYGSRADVTLAGGDIDLLVVSETLGFTEKLDLLLAIQRQLGEQRIDLTIIGSARLAGDTFFSQLVTIKLA